MVARSEISHCIYNEILPLCDTINMRMIHLLVFSNLVSRISWLSDREEGDLLHIKKPTCSGNEILYFEVIMKIELRSLMQVSQLTKKSKIDE